MELIAGAAGLGAKAAFDYNRENFLYDRTLRRRKNFKVMEFRIAQAQLWREDIRDLCSLTEYKMHVYLLVNVLLLGHTIVLWCQGKLPHKTPDWIMAGYAISTAGAGMFLLLSIWMAMHAAVAAQSYEARLLTQLVRLPIPSWNEVEACRTYASEFEGVEAKQMFRVPFAMGKQENMVNQDFPEVPAAPPPQTVGLSRTSSPADADVRGLSRTWSPAYSDDVRGLGRTSSPPSDLPQSIGGLSRTYSPACTEGGRTRPGGSDADFQRPSLPPVADPWGLERTDADIPELGCTFGSQVARLRHVKLARQAMVHWQSYDAFARISMSIGVDQLLLAMSYYILGYMLVEVGCRSAAVYGVILLTVLSETLLRLDMSLSTFELRLLQGLLAIGPVCSTLACLQWSKTAHSMRVAEALLVVSFLAHGSFILVLSHLARVDTDSKGVRLPRAFHSVLYLDVFGYVKPGSEDAIKGKSPGTTGAGSGATFSPAEGRRVSFAPSGTAATAVSESIVPGFAVANEAAAEADFDRHWGHEVTQDPCLADEDGLSTYSGEGLHQRTPGIGSVRCDAQRKPRASRPDDWQPEGYVEDLRDQPGAPQVDGGFAHEDENVDDLNFYNSASWLRKDQSSDENVGELPEIVTGHEGTAPRILPWQTFTFAMRTLAAAWLAAGVWYGWSVCTGGSFKHNAKYHVAHVDEHVDVDNSEAKHASLLGFGASVGLGASVGHHRGTVYDADLQEIHASWPFSDLMPRSLACDVAGSHFVASDGVLMLSARLPDDIIGSEILAPKLAFDEMQCAHLEGEGVQDAAVACVAADAGDRSCEALVLHRHGRRLAACALPGADGAAVAGGGEGFSANVSDAWLNRLRDSGVSFARRPGAAVSHTRVEKVVAVSSEAACGSECTTLRERWKKCTLLGTTHNRVVEVREHQLRGEMIPSEVLSGGTGNARAGLGHVRPLDADRLGLLQADGRAVQVLDSSGTQTALLELPEEIPAAGFCAGGGYLYFLGTGPSPALWRTPLPPPK